MIGDAEKGFKPIAPETAAMRIRSALAVVGSVGILSASQSRTHGSPKTCRSGQGQPARRPGWVLALLAALLLGASRAQAIQIVLDYQFDTSSFFASQNSRDAMQAAASFFDNQFIDQLSAIQPGGSNSWTAGFWDPSGSNTRSVSNLTVNANQLIVYVGAQDYTDNTLATGSPGWSSGTGSSEFVETMRARGQSGALAQPATDFGPWGGSISFDSSGTIWNFEVNTGPSGGQTDFYSVALHELGHVLGIGTASSWDAQVSGSSFVGSYSQASFGRAVPLGSGQYHWANGTMSLILGTTTAQEAALDPSLAQGTRKIITDLDLAGLRDVGWQAGRIWKGTAGSNWDLSSPNWNGGIAFVNGVDAILDDTGSNSLITLASAVTPQSLKVTNSVVNYTISGSGAINGSTGLAKNGSGTLTIATTNGFTGGTTINGGTVVVNAFNALGTGAVSTANSGTLLRFASSAQVGGLNVGADTLVSLDAGR